ncbi:MAG TPA: cation-transporting P-type ATPase [Caldisericia bacterium]|nr:cation-transporting P-type ATPase [Caldisericia bacterium]
MTRNDIGLTSAKAKELLAKFGPNRIFKPYTVNFIGIFIEEVTEPMILLLIAVGIIYSFLGELGDSITIFSIIVLLTLAEVFNEYRAKKAVASLGEIATPKSRVIRDGNVAEVDSLEVVPGDVLALSQGTKVAADAKIIRSVGLQVDESALTGESFPQDRDAGESIFAGTAVVFGEGEAIVEKTGASTRLGEIAAKTKAVKPPKTALQRAMKSLSGQLVWVALFFSIMIPLVGFLRGGDWKAMILTGLTLSFATIPEELPIIITMVLGIGSYRLSKKNFLIKKLKAAETLGNTTVIVTDKTGTITQAKMSVAATFPKDAKESLSLALLSTTDYSSNPLETSIKQKALELGASPASPEIFRQRSVGDGKKSKSVIRKNDSIYTLYKSGAPEDVLASCASVPKEVSGELEKQAENGRRVIAVATKNLTQGEAKEDFDKLEKQMTFESLIAFEDPPRDGVRETIIRAKGAGIRTIMVTGDHPKTAAFIANQVGIDTANIVTGDKLDLISDSELKETVRTMSVFARTVPEHKYRIVKALQENSEVVAVTGDGINDVLALKGADIGIAMGKRGTDVARDAAEVVLSDDNYNTIASGIFEGRAFFDNLQKGLKYYLSVKIALVLTFLLPVILGVPMPFAPIQIIALELFMDLAASAAFVAEPKESSIYTRRPRNPKENVLGPKVLADIAIKGFALFAVVWITYGLALWLSIGDASIAKTLAFAAWMFGHVALAFASRSDRKLLVQMNPFGNVVMDLWGLGAIAFLLLGAYVPYLNERLGLFPISPSLLLWPLGIAVVVMLLLEVRKLFGWRNFQ